MILYTYYYNTDIGIKNNNRIFINMFKIEFDIG